MVVVAIAIDPARPPCRLCSNIGWSAEESKAEEDGSAVEEAKSAVDVVVMMADWAGLPAASSLMLSRLTRGVPVVMVVATDWLREVRVC